MLILYTLSRYFIYTRTLKFICYVDTSELHIYICTHSKNCFIQNWIIMIYQLTDKLTKVKLTLEQAMKTQRRSRGIALLFLNLGVRSGWVVNISIHEHLKTFCIYLYRTQGNQIPGLTGRSLSIGFSEVR
jgi:hypothetical protein